MQKKECKVCKNLKSTELFYKARDGKFGCRGTCIECDKVYHKTYNDSRVSTDKTKLAKKESSIRYKNKHRQKIRQYARSRYKNNMNHRIRSNLSSRLSSAVKKNNFRAGNTIEILGCSIQQFRDYIESKFTQNMSWDNYGEWHLDHIRPCCSFDLSKEENQRECFHYSNFQPLWAKDNLSKGGRWSKATPLQV